MLTDVLRAPAAPRGAVRLLGSYANRTHRLGPIVRIAFHPRPTGRPSTGYDTRRSCPFQ